MTRSKDLLREFVESVRGCGVGCFHFHGIDCPCGFERDSEGDFADPNNPSLNGFYDQVAWFTNKSGEIALSMEYAGGRSFDFLPHVCTETVLIKNSISHRMLDHYPLWVEFEVRNR